MVKAIDLIGSNKQLQDHWVRRIAAAIIDGIIMFVIWIIITILIAIASIIIPLMWVLYPFFSGLLWVLYSAVLETMSGATIGKRVLNLQVVPVEGPMDFIKALIRNISKIYWILILIDWIVGFVTDGDPRQRFLDRVADTTVVRTDMQEVFLGAYQPPAGPMPAPYYPHAGPSPYPPQQASYQGPSQPQPYPQPQSAVPRQEYTPPETQETAPMVPKKESTIPTAEGVPKEYTRDELVNLRKDELMKIARDKNMKISGTKRDLIDRILGEEVEG